MNKILLLVAFISTIPVFAGTFEPSEITFKFGRLISVSACNRGYQPCTQASQDPKTVLEVMDKVLNQSYHSIPRAFVPIAPLSTNQEGYLVPTEGYVPSIPLWEKTKGNETVGGVTVEYHVADCTFHARSQFFFNADIDDPNLLKLLLSNMVAGAKGDRGEMDLFVYNSYVVSKQRWDELNYNPWVK